MLQQHNFQKSKPKKRKLYTPLSDEDENFKTEIKSKTNPVKVDLGMVKNCTVESREQAQKSRTEINGNV